MQISEHYSAYEHETLIVVTNNESAKIFRAKDHTIDEVNLLLIQKPEIQGRGSGTPNDGPPDIDEIKNSLRLALYKNLSDYLLREVEANRELDIVLCAPEAHKVEIQDAMHADVAARISALVPKNLASLPTDQIIRILQEHRS
ncbi:MAG: hypothetical protein WC730_00885 [Patescibacteria group bacterium]|jgi:hypothetical protein